MLAFFLFCVDVVFSRAVYGGKSAQRHRYDLDGFVLRCGVGCIFRDSDCHKLFSQKIRRF